MNRVTKRDITELLTCVNKMKAAQGTAKYPEAVGAVQGQAAIVRIDLEVYESLQIHTDPLGLVSTVDRITKPYVARKRCSAEPCQKQVEGENWFCAEHLKEEEHV